MKNQTFRLNENEIERTDRLHDELENADQLRKESEYKIKNQMSDLETKLQNEIDGLNQVIKNLQAKLESVTRAQTESTPLPDVNGTAKSQLNRVKFCNKNAGGESFELSAVKSPQHSSTLVVTTPRSRIPVKSEAR